MKQRSGTAIRPRRMQGFTLIELLVVIGIIALLVGILFPALAVAQKKAKQARARAEIGQVVTAWTEYLNDYLDFPDLTITNMGATAVQVLRGGTTGLGETWNPRHVAYLDFRSDATAHLDPWGSCYRVALDRDGDNRIQINNDQEIYGCVAAWSYGPDRTDDSGERGSDDVVSWRK